MAARSGSVGDIPPEEALHRALSDHLRSVSPDFVDGEDTVVDAADIRVESPQRSRSSQGHPAVAPIGTRDSVSPDRTDAPDAGGGKLFVGGLSWRTSPERLKEVFEQFGEVKHSQVMRDSQNGSSRGFGFVTFARAADAASVVAHAARNPMTLDGRRIDPKMAIPKTISQRERRVSTPERLDSSLNKVFVGGFSQSSTVPSITECFHQFGEVVDVVLMHDRVSHRPRGFGFVTFASEASVAHVVNQRYVDCDGKLVECKRAEPKPMGGSPAGGDSGRSTPRRSSGDSGRRRNSGADHARAAAESHRHPPPIVYDTPYMVASPLYPGSPVFSAQGMPGQYSVGSPGVISHPLDSPTFGYFQQVHEMGPPMQPMVQAPLLQQQLRYVAMTPQYSVTPPFPYGQPVMMPTPRAAEPILHVQVPMAPPQPPVHAMGQPPPNPTAVLAPQQGQPAAPLPPQPGHSTLLPTPLQQHPTAGPPPLQEQATVHPALPADADAAQQAMPNPPQQPVLHSGNPTPPPSVV